MSRHRYPIGTLTSDYMRVVVGLLLTLGPLLVLELATPVAWLLGSLAVLFAWFGLRTVLRQLSSVELSAQGIAIRGPIVRHLGWDELARVKLAYYAPRSWGAARRRDLRSERREPGRMAKRAQASAAGCSSPCRARAAGRSASNSTLEAFDQVLRQATAAAARRQIELDPTTTANLSALGIDRDDAADAQLRQAASGRGLAADPAPRGSL